MIKNNSDISVCGFTRKDEKTKKIYSVEMTSMKYDILDINEKNICKLAFINPAPWGKLFKKSILNNVWFETEKKMAGEDLLFYLNYIPNVKKISFVRESLIDYMVSPNSGFITTDLEMFNNLKKCLVDVKYNYEKMNNLEYLKLLDYIVFLHIAIGEAERICETKFEKLRKNIKDNKEYLNKYFPKWKKIEINYGGLSFKSFFIFIGKLMYKIGMFNIYIRLYNFLLHKLKVSVKW